MTLLLESFLSYLINLAAGLRLSAIDAKAKNELERDLATFSQQIQDRKQSRSFTNTLELIPVNVAKLKNRLKDAFTEGPVTNLCVDPQFQRSVAHYFLEKDVNTRKKIEDQLLNEIVNAFNKAGATKEQAIENASIFFEQIQKKIFENQTLSNYLINQKIDLVIKKIDGQGRNLCRPMQRPRQAEYFTGREEELNKLINDLQQGKIVTLCGPGGIGKSALAAEAMWLLSPESFPDGIISHCFYTTPQAELALEHIALSLGEDPKPSPALAAQRALAGRKVLLLLDGTEDADDLRKVLDVVNGCGVLITSRKHSDAVGEWQNLKALPLDSSISLLKAWGKKQVQDTESTQRICELLGGLPLAIRIAGRYMDQTSENALYYLDWLETTPLSALDYGQRKLDSVPLLLERSMRQVSESARQTLYLSCHLAFSPFSLEVAMAALDMSKTTVKKCVGQLVLFGFLLKYDKLAAYEVSHALIHTYISHKKLLERSVYERLVFYYQKLAEEQCLKGPEGFARLEIEREHLMRVLDICKDQLHQRAVIDFGQAIYDYLNLKGYRFDQIIVLEKGLKASKDLKDRQEEVGHLNRLGTTYQKLGNPKKAISYHEQAIAIARESNNRKGEGISLGNLGSAYRELCKYKKAIGYSEQALAIKREIGDREGEGSSLRQMAGVYRIWGQIETAIDYNKQSLAIAREIDDLQGEGSSLHSLGNAYHYWSQHEKAIDYYEKSLAIVRKIGDRQSEGLRLGSIGSGYLALGQYEQAINYIKQALAIQREIGNRNGEGSSLNHIGGAYTSLGQIKKGISYHKQALSIAREIGNRQSEGNCLINIGLAYRHLKQSEKAIEYYKQALVIHREIGDLKGEGIVLSNIGLTCRFLGQDEKAVEYYEQAIEISRKLGNRLEEGKRIRFLGRAYSELGQYNKAFEYFNQSLVINREIDNIQGVSFALNHMGGVCRFLGQDEKAIDYYKQELVIYRETGKRQQEGSCLGKLGRAYCHLGQVEKAKEYYEKSISILEEIDSPKVEEVQKWLSELTEDGD
jgi:tetratricopeptide (TPR) repeat protein